MEMANDAKPIEKPTTAARLKIIKHLSFASLLGLLLHSFFPNVQLPRSEKRCGNGDIILLRFRHDKLEPPQLLVAEAAGQVVVYQARCLHVTVADGWTHKLEASPFQLSAHGTGLLGFSRHLRERFEDVVDGFAAHEFPDELVEAAEFALDFKEVLGVGYSGVNFCAVLYHAIRSHEASEVARGVLCDFFWVEVVKRCAEPRSPLQNESPREPSLKRIQNQKLKMFGVVVDGDAPLLIVVPDIERCGNVPASFAFGAHGF
jgi:hypothetical protein